MAKASLQVIDALRATAAELETSAIYQWGHMGSCNCGFLAQKITHLKKDEIHSRAMQRYGDWSDQINDYCPTSGLPMDDLISEMVAFGLDADDLKHLERLSDHVVLRALPPEQRNLKHNVKADVILYLMTWASLLESKLLEEITLEPNEIFRSPSILQVQPEK
ncbi:MAG: hypothetical protein ACOYXT_24645 [Bacteroidota bacterium]